MLANALNALIALFGINTSSFLNRRRACLAAAASLSLLAAPPATLRAQVSFAEFPVPTAASAVKGIVTGPDGAIWFAENAAGNIGRLTVNGMFTEYSAGTGTGVYQLAVGADGNLYFTPGNDSFIGQINPSTGKITQFPIPNLGSNVAAPTGIAVDAHGNIWFAEAGTAVNAIGELTVTSATSFNFATPIPVLANSEPNLLTIGPDGNLWFTEECPTATGCDGIGRIGMINITTRALSETQVGAGTFPFGIVSDAAHNKLWFTERDANAVASITTAGTVSAPIALSSGAAPLGITLGVDGALWVAESGTNKIAEITTSGALTAEYSIPTSSSGPYGITVGPDRALWFTEDLANNIGRISSISFESFAQVPGALTQISIGADGSVYGINSGDQIYTYNFSNSSWSNIPGGLMFITAGSNTAVWGLNYQNHIYHLNYDQTNPSASTWAQVGGELNSLAVGADGDVWGLNTNNSIYRYFPSDGTFHQIGTTASTLASLAVGSAGAVYGLNAFGSVYWYNPGGGYFQWVDTTVGFSKLAVGVDGDVWAVKGGVPYHWDVLHNTFDATSGVTGVTQIAVGSGASVFALADGGTIWQWDATAQMWVPVMGALVNIGVGANGTVWGINSAQQIYRLQGAPVRPSQTLSIIPGATLDQISVGVDGAVWGVHSGTVEFFNSGTQTFQAVPGAPTMTQVSVGAGNDVWGVDSSGAIYEYIAGSSPTWKLIPGQLNLVQVGADGSVWGINAPGQTYYYDFGASSWVNIPGQLGTLSVGADGDVWGINGSLQVYRYTGGASGSWQNIPGSLTEISVGSKDNVWGINAQNQIYTYRNGGWTQISGSLDEVWASFDGAVWGVNGSDNLYRWNGTNFVSGGSASVTEVLVGNAVSVWATNATSGAVYAWF